MRSPVVRWPVAHRPLPELVPQQLDLMRHLPLGRQRPAVYRQLFQLFRCSPEGTPWLVLVVAPPVHMEERGVPDGTPAIGNQYGRLKLRHKTTISAVVSV